MRKKGLFFIGGLFIISFAFFLFGPKKEHIVDKALSHFLEGNVFLADHLLYKLEKKSPSYPIFYQKAFLAQMKGKFAEADLLFQKGVYALHKEEEIHDLFLGKALGFYFQRNFKEIPPLLEKIQKIDRNSPQLQLIEALYKYETGQYADFICYVEQNKKEKKRNWVQGVLNHYFPEDWIEIHYAHALIEEKKYKNAREILEKYIDSSPCSYHLSELALLYSGYSYLKEASSLAFFERKSFLNIALFYFGRGEEIPEEKSKIAPSVLEEISSLLQEEQDNHYASSFIHLLEKWQEKTILSDIADKMVEKITHKNNIQSSALCNFLKEEFEGGIFHTFLIDKMFLTMQSHLKEKNSNPYDIWQQIEAISTSVPSSYSEKIATLAEEEIINLLQKEKEPLSLALQYLKFWKILENRDHKFVHTLLDYGMLFWRKENEEHKGSHLLKIALYLADESTKMKLYHDIEDFFIALYAQAQNANMVGRLCLIYDAMQEFKIGFKGLFTKGELANHLADAAYFFSIHNYQVAKMHAEWVAKVDPQNEEALRYVGLSSFHLGDYPKAIMYLKKLNLPDEKVKMALAMSEANSSNEAIAQVPIDFLDSLAVE